VELQPLRIVVAGLGFHAAEYRGRGVRLQARSQAVTGSSRSLLRIEIRSFAEAEGFNPQR